MKKIVFWIIVVGLIYFLKQKVFVLPLAKEGECFKEHFISSLQLNETRKPLYNKASSSSSKSISSRVVWMEKIALMLGNVSSRYRFDERDAIYRNEGVSVICDTLIPISKTPEFAASYEDGVFPNAASYSFFSATTTRDDLQIALRKGGFEGLKEEALKRESSLVSSKTNCLVRYVLRTLARTAAMAPSKIAQAEEKGLPSPEPLIRDYISFQILGLGFGNWIDESATKVQERGVPILCRDFPEVPVP